MAREPPVPVRAGQVIAGKYRIEKLLGAGGMGIVVSARHLRLGDERVAIKFLQKDALQSSDALERFDREARAMFRLKSEHVARVFDVDELPDGTRYIVMEYLQGEDLHQVLSKWKRLETWDAVSYVLQACEAVAEAHANGIVHRDLKPQNLFLTRRVDGTPQVKVLDFGISKMPGSASDLTLTDTSAIMGSPLYMSPEQLRATRLADARSDIWALGVVLYELLAGQLPYMAESAPELYAMMVQGPPEPPTVVRPELPPDLVAVVMRCLQPDPTKRYASVAELAAALEPFGPDNMSGAGKRIAGVRPRLAPTPPDGTLAADARAAAGAPAFDPHAPTREAGALVAAGTGVAWDNSDGSSKKPRHRLIAAIIGGAAGAVGALAIATWLLLRGSHAPEADVKATATSPTSASAPETPPTPTPTSTSTPTPTPTSTSTSTSTASATSKAAPRVHSTPTTTPKPRASDEPDFLRKR